MSYVTVQQARDEGVPGGVSEDITDTVLQAKLDQWSEFIDRACRQWFESRTITLDLDGNDSRVLFLPVPVIELTALYVNSDFSNALPTTHYRVYNNRTFLRDDRRNPKIELATTGLGVYDSPLFTCGEFVRGTQNQRVVGSFGFVEEDGSTPLLIARAVLRLTIRELLKGGTAGTLWESMQSSSPGGPVQSETTDGHSIAYDVGNTSPARPGLNGITGDAEVDGIIALHRAPIAVSSTKGAGGPDRRWR